MTKATERQLCQVGGTLLGWLLAQMYDKKDTVPFTVIGGTLGFIVSQEIIGDGPKRSSSLKGFPKKRKRVKK